MIDAAFGLTNTHAGRAIHLDGPLAGWGSPLAAVVAIATRFAGCEKQ